MNFYDPARPRDSSAAPCWIATNLHLPRPDVYLASTGQWIFRIWLYVGDSTYSLHEKEVELEQVPALLSSFYSSPEEFLSSFYSIPVPLPAVKKVVAPLRRRATAPLPISIEDLFS